MKTVTFHCFDKVLKNQSKHCIFIAKLRVVIPVYFQYTEYVDLNWSMRIKTSKWCPFLRTTMSCLPKSGSTLHIFVIV